MSKSLLLLFPFLLVVALALAGQRAPALQELPAVPSVPTESVAVKLPALPTTILPQPALPGPRALSTLSGAQPEWTPSQAPPTTPTPLPPRPPSRDPALLAGYQQGVAYVALGPGDYRAADSFRSLDELFATGANYISLVVIWYQENLKSTEILPSANTPSAEDLARVVDYAHAHGVHVLLKPQVDFTADPSHWRGQISFDTAAQWQAWFSSYRQFILTYAQFAQEHGVEEYSVGTELEGTSKRADDWRSIIRDVRAVYSGLLTYSANHSGEEVQVQFWDALDLIGINNFYHLTNFRDPTVAQLLEGWKLPVLQVTRVHARFPDKPVIFTEVGYPSLDRANVWPWNWNRTAAVDVEEQARAYEALFQVWWHNPQRPWFRGLFIWDWLPDPAQGGLADRDYTPHGKPAEDVLRAWFGGNPSSSPYAEAP